MAIWKLAPSICFTKARRHGGKLSGLYIYVLRFIDPSCNPHLSLMSMYRKNIYIFKFTLPIHRTGELFKYGQKIWSKSHLHFRVIFDTGTGINRQLINMAVLVKYLKPEYCTTITALHIFTRCDSTSVSKGIGKLKPIKMLQTYARFQSILFYVCPCWGVAGYSKSPGRTWGVHLCHVWAVSIKRCQCSCNTCSSRRGVGYTMGL